MACTRAICLLCQCSLCPPLLTPTIRCNWSSLKASIPPVSVHMRITGRAAIQTSTHCGDINFTEPRHRDVFLLSHIAGSATIRVPADRGALTSAHFNSLPMYSGILLPSHIAGCAAIRVSADRGALTPVHFNLLPTYRDISTLSHIGVSAAIRVSADRGALTPVHFNSLQTVHV